MKKLTVAIIIITLAFALPNALQAQTTYQSAVGARLGYPLSLSLKHFVNDNSAVEAYVGTRIWSTYRWFSISGAYQYHQPIEIEGLPGLQWYAGGGASVYFWNFDFDTSASSTTLGLQGYVGLDYRFEDIPLNLTLDWIPTIFFSGYISGFGGGYGNLGVRYIFAE